MRQQKGYTLIELLVAITIFVILSTTVVFNLSQGRLNEDLRQAASELVLHLREVQSLALTGAVHQGNNPAGNGLHFSSNCGANCSYQIFVDTNANLTYNNGDAVTSQYRLARDIALIRVEVTGVTPSSNPPHSFLFSQPAALFYFNASQGREVHMYFKHQRTGRCRDVFVKGASGLIDETSFVSVSDGCK